MGFVDEPAAFEREHDGKAIEVVVTVQNADSPVSRGGGDQEVRHGHAVVKRARVCQLWHCRACRSDRTRGQWCLTELGEPCPPPFDVLAVARAVGHLQLDHRRYQKLTAPDRYLPFRRNPRVIPSGPCRGVGDEPATAKGLLRFYWVATSSRGPASRSASTSCTASAFRRDAVRRGSASSSSRCWRSATLRATRFAPSIAKSWIRLASASLDRPSRSTSPCSPRACSSASERGASTGTETRRYCDGTHERVTVQHSGEALTTATGCGSKPPQEPVPLGRPLSVGSPLERRRPRCPIRCRGCGECGSC